MRTIAEVQQLLAISREGGLSGEAVAASREHFGSNRLTPMSLDPLWKKFLEKFDEPIIKILLAAALLSMAVDLFRSDGGTAPNYIASGIAVGLIVASLASAFVLGLREWLPTILFLSALVLWPVGLVTGHPSYDGLAVMVAVILATGVAFLSEYKSDREFELLNARKDLQVKVFRDCGIRTIPMEDLVVGDVVALEMGDEVGADGRLVEATDLYLDQSLMTGESEPVRKQTHPLEDRDDGPEQPGCVYRGTQVVEGVGRMIVTEVGDSTYLGQIARRLMQDDDGHGKPAGNSEHIRIKRKLSFSKEATPLQAKLEDLARLISKVGYVAALAIFLALVARGFWFANPRELGLSEPGVLASTANLLQYFLYMVIIIVVAVPEGLPMSVTVSLALAMRKMTRANSLVRQLVACETIGSATVICSDKTGTLTQNKMQVVRFGWDGGLCDRDTDSWRAQMDDLGSQAGNNLNFATCKPLHWIALNAAANSTANLEEKDDGRLVPVGNSTEGAILKWLHECGLCYAQLRTRFPPLHRVHFSSDRKRMTTVVRHEDRLLALVKGAPEWLLEHSTRFQTDDGTTLEWSPPARASVLEQLDNTSALEMRTLAFGHVWLPENTSDEEGALRERRDALERDLIYAGFVAIRDPLREDVKEAVEQCRRAGIEVKMITGDNLETARAIGREVGLMETPDTGSYTPENSILTSQELNALSDIELTARLPRLRILARARPLDKLRLVKLLQEQGEVVAVTGDGTNDAPALKRADVGLSMGRSGTEVAKEASKIVLLDDAFSTIVKAVHWGRSLYENIQRFLQFQLTINVSALAIAFLGPFFGVKPPFTILQLLWINVIMDTFAAIALCSEPPRPGLMNMPPKRREENILTRSMVVTIFSTAAFFVVVMMLLLVGMRHGWWLVDPEGERSEEFHDLTVWQVSLFFTVYVFFQVWNEINCRSLAPEISGLRGLFRNPTFLGIAGLIVLGQVLIVTFGGPIFKVGPLRWIDWLGIALGTASVLVFAEIARRVRLAMRSD